MIRLSGFRYCPRCAGTDLSSGDGKSMLCGGCGFRYFHNMAAAVMGILETPQGILFTRRARDPGKSMLDLPGGFVDYGETLEGAVRREIREELGLELPVIRYFGSFPNTYAYRGVTYHTADAVFVCPVDPRNRMRLSDEIVETVVLRPADVNPDVLAFDSAKLALREYLARGSHF